MKYLILICLFLSSPIFGQQIINKITTKEVIVNGKINVSSTTIGSKPCPVMTEVQRDAIATPLSGSCIFNSTALKLNVYNGTVWKAAGGGVDNWATSTAYSVDDIVIQSSKIYQCLIAHTSGTFATDLAALKWTEISATGTIDLTTGVSGILPLTNGGTGNTSGTATINANLTGPITSVGNATSIASQTGTGSTFVVQNTPTLTTPVIGAATGTSLSLGGSINANAVLDVQSTTKAFMPPRMTTTQKQAIPTPTEGMFVHDNVIKMPSWYDGTNWQNGLGTITVDTDPASYSPTLSAGFGTTSNTNICKYWRTGSFLNASCYATIAGITTGIGSIGLPTGLTIDSAKLIANNTTSAEGQIVGLFGKRGTSENGYIVTATGTSTSLVYVAYAYDSNPNKLIPTSVDMNAVFTNGLTSFDFRVPIVGWASNGSTYSAANSNYGFTNGGAISITATTTSPTKGTVVTDRAFYQRNGQNGKFKIQFEQSAGGSAGSGDYLFTLPNSLAFDTNFITPYTGDVGGSAGLVTGAAQKAYIGKGHVGISGTDRGECSLFAYSSTQFRAVCVTPFTAYRTLSSSSFAFSNSTLGFDFEIDQPISGWSNVSQVVANISGYASVPGAAGSSNPNIDTFSVSYGTTSATTVCSASPCSYLDQIGNTASSVTRASAGRYTINFSKTYTKLKCVANVSRSPSYALTGLPVNCASCNSFAFDTQDQSGGTPVDTFGNISCMGQY